MKNPMHLFAPALVMTGLIAVSPAAVLLSENFDGYATQAALEAAWVPIGTVAPISGALATDQAASGLQSIRIDGTATNSQQRNERQFSESGLVTTTTAIVFSFDFYDSSAAAAPYRQHSFMQDGTTGAAGQIVGMGLNNNHLSSDSGGNYYMARITGYTPPTIDLDGGPNEGGTLGASAFFKLNDFANSPLRSDGWHNLKVVIGTNDGLSADFEFYVDGILAERVSNFGSAAEFRSYERIRVGSGVSNGGNTAWYDNIVVATVPEPSTAGLWLAGMMAFAWRRRRGA